MLLRCFCKVINTPEIQGIIGVSCGFTSKWTHRYQQMGVSARRLAYSGSVSYLEPEQPQAAITWLKTKNYGNLAELQHYIEDEYGVVFDSKQTYYRLFEQAGISWKKTQKHNPKEAPALVQKKTGDSRLVRSPSWRDYLWSVGRLL